MKLRPLALALFVFACLAVSSRAAVVINEIMYHPLSELETEEYIELSNDGAAAVDVSGWKFTNGVLFTIPAATSIPAGGYLVVVANAVAFHAKYPAVTNYIGNWIGALSNSANKVVLADNLNVTRDTVSYADDGDWGTRIKVTVADYGHKGWTWDSAADGGGKSLELINSTLDNNVGQNWGPSTAVNGTPGAANGIVAANVAPFITNVTQFPFVPTSAEPVNVTAQIVAATLAGVTVTVRYRNDGAASFTTAAMFDDGAHGDALAGDGIYGASLPAAANNTIVEFYVQAVDAGARSRTWPAPAFDDNLASGKTDQFCNALYQVDNTVYAGAMPYYKMVMRAVDKTELTTINTTPAQSYSHAKMNATWITRDGTGSDLVYLSSVRNRGHGSSSRQPQGYNIAFLNANTWKKVVSLNLNTQQTHSQLFGSALFRQAGLTCPDSRQAQLRVNGVDPTGGTAVTPSWGFYCANEVQDSDFAAHHFPLDSSGNIYRSQRLDSNLQQGDFSYIDNNPVSYQPVWFKHTNSSENNWSDLIGLCLALSKGHSDAAFATTYDAGYETGVQALADVREWMRFFAVNAIVDNSETNLYNGYGDDFYIYFGITDPHCNLVAYDLDTICGQGDAVPTPTQHGLFRMVNKDDAAGNGPTVMNSFMKNPTFAPIYYDELHKQLVGAFKTANFNALVDEILTGVVPAAQITSIKTFQTARTPYVASLVPLAISVTNTQTVAGAALPAEGGYTVSVASRATTTPASVTNADPAHCKLIGKANSITTRSVKVNGVVATWSAWQATWTAPSVTLTPGINKILIQSFDGSNVETERFTQDIWYDDASVATASGTLGANTNWTAAGGPYRVTANLIVPAGITLTIGAGTTVYVASGVTIVVNGTGKILATGTDTQRVVIGKEPTAAGNWGSLDFLNTTVESQLAYVNFSDGGGTNINGHAAQIHANNAIVFFDHLSWPASGLPAVQYISTETASFTFQSCTFPTYPDPGAIAGHAQPELLHGAGGILAGGHGIARDNYFGHSYGFNDTWDFTGGQRQGAGAGPILQIINNVFDGASDDCLDLDSTDAWIEGNIFLHVHRDPLRTDQAIDTGSAISGGVDFVNQNSDWTIINNLFYDVDHVFLNKGGATPPNGSGRIAFLYNTIAHVAKETSGSTAAEIAAFLWSDDNTPVPDVAVGAGLYAAHNILYDCPQLQRLYFAANHTVIFENNIFPVSFKGTAEEWTGAGSGNTYVDPRLNLSALNGIPVASVTAAQLRTAFQLLPDSPAVGTAFGARNKGGLGPHGIAIAGEPSGTTNATTATLTIGPGGTFNPGGGAGTWGTTAAQPWGWTAYKWKLDGGAYSGEIVVTNNSPFTSPATISLSGLTNGTHTVTVVGKNDAGYYQDDTFVYPLTSGTPAAATVSKTWTVNTAYVPPPATANVLINEVLAKNAETIGFGSTFPDIIELRNTGTATADLSGWGLTDNTAIPYKYAIPNGTMLAAGAYLVIYADSAAAVPSPKTGFGLKQAGDTLTFTRSVAAGGGVADSVAFGAQLPDYSIGRRVTDGGWDMCVPTFGAANVVAAQGVPSAVLINEWLADEQLLVSTDFIELFNPSARPVNLGGCYLTDNPVENITASQLRQLTFLGASGYASFKADSDPSQGPDHLTFKLTPVQGEIGFFDSAQNLIDRIIYGSQSTDVSQGRTPNGASTFAFFNQPTPGAPNPVAGGTGTATIALVPANQSWKYYNGVTAEPAVDGSGRTYEKTAFDDALWSSGQQLLYIETAGLVNAEGFAKTTLLTGLTTTKPYQTYYFRTHFNYANTLTGVTLTLTTMLDDGCILYLNGQELVPTSPAGRIGMAAGAFTWVTLTDRNVSDAAVETFTVPSTALVVGDNVLAVEVHQTALQSSATTSSDIVWGMKLDATVPTAGALLNEVLANNVTLQDPDGSFSGWIELYNPGATAVDVSDMSLTDDTLDARKWVFPTGSSIAANGFLVVYCNPLAAASTVVAANMNTGFALRAAGGRVFLFGKLSGGGTLQDSVNFGQQVPDRSIGRIANGVGAFTLNTVTRGATNTGAALGAISTVKINEWLALPAVAPSWFELHNSGALPVLLSGNFLTDNLVNKTKFLVGPLAFIGGTGNSGNARWLQLLADNDSGVTPNHVNFTLNPAGEALAIFSASGVQLESVSFGAQTAGISGGRLADGTSTITQLNPTPGSANQSVSQDTDLDGIPDWWETLHGFNPGLAADALLDTDGDGQNNRAEYVAGTDPRNASDTLRANITTTTPGQFHIQFIAQTGHGYTIQYKNLLTDAAWTFLTSIAAPSVPTPVDFTDTTVGANTKRFYRVLTP